MWWIAVLGCSGPTPTPPAPTGETGAPPIPSGDTATIATAPTGDTGPEGPTFELSPIHEWGLPDWVRPQHHAQLLWTPDGATLYVGFSEGDYLPDPTVRLSTVDGGTGEVLEARRLGGDQELLGLKASLSLDDQGRVVTTWQRADGGVYYERVTPGVAATELFEIQAPNLTSGAGNHSPDLQLLPDGRAVVAWYSQSELDEDAAYFTRILAPDPALDAGGGTVAVVPDRGVATPELALTPSGEVLLAWSDFAQPFPTLVLSWLGTDALPARTTTIYGDGGFVSRPQLAVAGDGRIAITYPVHPGKLQSVVALSLLSPDGTPIWGPLQPFAVPAQPDLSTLAWIGDDRLLVAWSAPEDAPDGGIFLALLADDGAVLVPPVRVSDPIKTLARRPALAVDERPGEPVRFALSWEQPDAQLLLESDVFGVIGVVPDLATSP